VSPPSTTIFNQCMEVRSRIHAELSEITSKIASTRLPFLMNRYEAGSRWATPAGLASSGSKESGGGYVTKIKLRMS